MIYIYDILLNWNKNKLYEFYEWEKTDQLEHIKKIPLYKVSEELLNILLEYNIKIDPYFISKVYNLTESYTSKKVNKISYALILCDGLRTLAIKTDKEGNIKYKSKLLLDEEEEVISLTNKISKIDFEYKKKEKLQKERLITRKEEVIKKYLQIQFDDCYKRKKYDKLMYLYKEYSDNTNNDPKSIYSELKNSLENDINEDHKHLYSLLQMIANNN